MEEHFIPASCDNLQLSILLIKSNNPKGIIQFVHGMCEHKERYIPVMEYFAENGYICVCHDHRGHGQLALQNKVLGYMDKGGWKALVDDTAEVTKWIKALYPNLKLTLLGHSMGSLIVRCYVKKYPKLIDKLIVCGSPSDNPGKGIGYLLSCLYKEKSRPKLLLALTLGGYNKGFEQEGYPCAWICTNPEILKEYHSDPLCMFSFTANGYKALLGLLIECYKTKINVDFPVYFICGENDPCIIDKKHFLKAVAMFPNASHKIYPSMRHEILNETDKIVVWKDILAWIENSHN